MKRVIFHVDVNSAFLSWSAVKRLKENPDAVDLRRIPSAVGGDIRTRHGVITARSIPAKKFGVKTGEPLLRALEKCPNLVTVPSDFVTYKEYSRKFIEILKKYSTLVEQVSIDEAFVDMTGTEELFRKEIERGGVFPFCAADKIKNEIYEMLGFTVNIGISSIKLLAKMASDFEKPDKVHTLYEEEIEEKMWKLPIGELHGCGRVTAKTLRNIGIKTIGDGAKTEPDILCSVLGEKVGNYIHRSCNGKGSDVVAAVREEAKSYSNETTIVEDVNRENYEVILKVVNELSDKVAKRLKKDGCYGGTVSIGVKTNDFKRFSRQKRLEPSTNDEKVIAEIALGLLQELCFGEGGIFEKGLGIRLVGVGTSNLDRGEYRQMDIFSYLKK